MVRKYYEISCDTCHCGEQYLIGNGSINEQARENGWIITADGRHYDSKECYEKGKNNT